MWLCSNQNIARFMVLGACVLGSLVSSAEDWAAKQQIRNEERAAYREERGYLVDPSTSTTCQMVRAAAESRRPPKASSVSAQGKPNTSEQGVFSGVPTQGISALATRPGINPDIQQYYKLHFGEEEICALKSLFTAFGRPVDLSNSEWDSVSHEAACDLQSLLGVTADGKTGSNTLSALSAVVRTTNEAPDDTSCYRAPLLTPRQGDKEDDSDSGKIPKRLIEREKPEDNGGIAPWRIPRLGQPNQPNTASGLSDFSSNSGPTELPVAPGEKRKAEPSGRYLGNWSANQFAPDSTSNRFGAGSELSPDSVRNKHGRYGSPYSNESANNPYATNAPRLYDSKGNYRGKLSTNPYDPESISNPYGRYGSRFSPDSVNNPFGAGSPYSADSPTNPFGQGLRIHGEK